MSWLKYVPEKLRSHYLCVAAVKEDGLALEFVPKAIFAYIIDMYKHEASKTSELCFTAVNQDGFALQFVPDELKSPDICLAAVRKEGDALEYVPEALLTHELCDIAALDCLPERIAEILKIKDKI